MFCFFQAEDGIRDLVRSRGLGDVYKRQAPGAEGDRVTDVARNLAGDHVPHHDPAGPAVDDLSLIHI